MVNSINKPLHIDPVLQHIRIISPSGAIDPELIEGAAQRLLSWGYHVSVAPHATQRWGRFAATDEERLQDLNEAIADPTVDMILCARGGYGLQRIIDRVEGEKMIIGFSDITELHQRMHCPTLHAIMCKHIASLPEDSEPIRYLRQALRGETLSYSVPAHPLNRYGIAEGILIGGNLSVLYGLQGIAPLQLSPWGEGKILFLEDIAERHYHIDRMMQNLRMSGVLANLIGLVVGQFSDCDDDPGMGETIYETILRAVEDYDYPVLFDFPAGHVERNLPLRMNASVTIHVTPEYATLQQ